MRSFFRGAAALIAVVCTLSPASTWAAPVYSLANPPVYYDPNTPPIQAGLVGQYDGSQITTSGAAVTSWTDRASGGGLHPVTQAAAGFRPTQVTGGINGLNYVHFDGTDVLASVAYGVP